MHYDNPMTQFYSHVQRDENKELIDKKPLIQHLREVAEAARAYINRLPDAIARKDLLKNLAFHIGLSHDLGKYTSFFQLYLLNGKNSGELKAHSLISALWGGFGICQGKYPDGDDKIYALLLTLDCILHHHGNLETIMEILSDVIQYSQPERRPYLEPRRKKALDVVVQQQIPDLLRNGQAIENELRAIDADIPALAMFLKALNGESREFIKLLKNARLAFQEWAEKGQLQRFNQDLYLLFSALIDADKRDAGQVVKEVGRPMVNDNIVKIYRQKFKFDPTSSDLIRIREKLFDNLDRQADHLPLQQKLFSLTAPTGSGKTLAVLNFALKLRTRIQKEEGYLPRIIYALPFTTIIDQNHQVFEDVLSHDEAFERQKTAFLLKHHHLANMAEIARTIEADGYPLDKALLLVESWESEIVVTTFVQFFHSIISQRNRALKKYHNIPGSIIILDEIQNIPIEYWRLIKNSLSWLAQASQCRFILMTATQPLIFESDQILELVDAPDQYFTSLDRITFHFNSTTMELETFCEYFMDHLEPDKSYAIILNTINSSLKVFDKLRKMPGLKMELFYLSTNLIPKHRKETIKAIKDKLKQKVPLILVSTQVIEAGVDLDFDVIYRDIAPIDSIVQSAGRANRHGLTAKGQVNVVRLVSAEQKEFAHWVYGKAHLAVAKALLGEHSEMGERDFYHLVRENYRQLVEKNDLAYGENLFQEWWHKANYGALKNFRLIDFAFNYIDVFIAVDKEAEKTWNNYLEKVLKERNFSTRQQNYLAVRSDFRQYVISIPAKLAKIHFWDVYPAHHIYIPKREATADLTNDLELNRRIGYIGLEDSENYYETATGFKRTESTETMIF